MSALPSIPTAPAALKRLAEVRRQVRVLEETNARLRQADQAKDTFLSMVSHELRTPINAIMGFGDMLEDGVAGELNQQQQAYVHQMVEGANRLLTLVEDLLDVSRIDAGQLKVDPRPV